MTRLETCIFTLILSHLSYAYSKCPEDNGPPCWCQDFGFGDTRVVCRKVASEGELRQAISRLQGHSLKFLEIEETSLKFLPSDLFQELDIKEIYIRKCQFASLSDGDVAFEGLEDTLTTLTFLRTNFTNGWKWSHLKRSTKLKNLGIFESNGILIDESIKEISHLDITNFYFARNSLKSLHETALSTFQSLRNLDLDRNFISEVKRSMFPNPAKKLQWFNLGENRLKLLPPDLFTNMPDLQVIRLANNQIVTLEQRTFDPLTRRWFLSGIYLHGNPLKCDCRLGWLLKYEAKSKLVGECAEPENLKSKEIKHLTETDLSC